MIKGDIVVDICRENNALKLGQLVAASQAYWSSKGYTLISNAQGKDFVRIFASNIDSGSYDEGASILTKDGDVILVYEQ
jgi:hypothetical protein